MSSTWIIYASEVSGAIGINKYKKRWEVLMNMWKRVSPATYEAAVKRYEQLESKPFKKREDQISNVIRQSQLQDFVQDILCQPVESSADVRTKLDVVNDTMKTYEESVKQKKTQMEEEIKECEYRLCDDNVKPEEILAIQNEIKIKENLLNEQKQIYSDFKEAKKEVTSLVRTQFGQHREQKDVENKTMGIILENNGKFYKTILGQTPQSWGIGGKIDGFRDGVLIEIKNRVNQIFDPIPIYDQIQLQCYMHLLNKSHAIMIQCWNGQRKETEVKRDVDMWQNQIYPELNKFVHALFNLIKNNDVQDKMLTTPDNQKFRVMNNLLKSIKI